MVKKLFDYMSIILTGFIIGFFISVFFMICKTEPITTLIILIVFSSVLGVIRALDIFIGR